MTDSGTSAHPVVVFDVNETLSDTTAMAARFADLGAPEPLARLWFATLLRDGFARTAAGASERFDVLADGALRTVLHGVEINVERNAAVEHVLAGFAQLPVHPDVPDGVRMLRDAGFRLVTLSNGSADVADQLLRRAGLREAFDKLLTVADAGSCARPRTPTIRPTCTAWSSASPLECSTDAECTHSTSSGSMPSAR